MDHLDVGNANDEKDSSARRPKVSKLPYVCKLFHSMLQILFMFYGDKENFR